MLQVQVCFLFVLFFLHIRVKHKTPNFLAHNLPLVETGRREEAVVIVRLSDTKRFNTGATQFCPRSIFHSYITVKSFFFFFPPPFCQLVRDSILDGSRSRSRFTLCLLLQPGPGGLGQDQGLLDDRGRVFLPQQLHLHLLTHRVEVQRQVAERQALLAAVAVGSGRRVTNDLMRRLD